MRNTNDGPEVVASCDSCLTRRAFVAGAGALSLAALPGCATYGQAGGTQAAPADTPPPGAALAKTDAIPVGGGTIFTDAQVVVTQPTPGVFKAFSGVCTHQGCLVSKIESGTIGCECHGSRFTLDGAVANGPAASPLPGVQITVAGADIILGAAASPAASAEPSSSGPSADKTQLARTSDIPVGGGAVFADAGVVVTQPNEGTFEAFSTSCTHQGCTVAGVQDGTINCPCHGSAFNATDGSVVRGPATRALARKKIRVENSAITLV